MCLAEESLDHVDNHVDDVHLSLLDLGDWLSQKCQQGCNLRLGAFLNKSIGYVLASLFYWL